jgi:hypothetical protein
MQYTHVEPLYSVRTNRPVANQYVISRKGVFAFQSYHSLCAVVDVNGHVTLGEDWDYSQTTLKYLYQFLQKFAYSTWRSLPPGKSYKERIFKAICIGLITYDRSIWGVLA